MQIARERVVAVMARVIDYSGHGVKGRGKAALPADRHRHARLRGASRVRLAFREAAGVKVEAAPRAT
jgi:hypothetical protein